MTEKDTHGAISKMCKISSGEFLTGKRPESSAPSLPWDVPSCRRPEQQRPMEKGGWVTAKRALKSSEQAVLRSTRVFLETLEIFSSGAAVAEGLPCPKAKPSSGQARLSLTQGSPPSASPSHQASPDGGKNSHHYSGGGGGRETGKEVSSDRQPKQQG